jgi:phosphatidylserine decarboxylase
MQFTVVDSSNPSAAAIDILKRLATTIGLDADDEEEYEDSSQLGSQDLLDGADDDDEDEDDNGLNTSDETDDLSKPEKAAKKKRKLRLKRLRSKTISRAYEFAGGSDVTGIVFLEIKKIVDLPPERNSECGNILSVRVLS